MRNKQRIRLVECVATYDKNGNKYKIDIYATEIDMAEIGSTKPEWTETLREARHCGKLIYQVDDTTYHINNVYNKAIVVRKK